jgi:multidrug efflux pump subunit AcrA (membrane-fusion protein)
MSVQGSPRDPPAVQEPVLLDRSVWTAFANARTDPARLTGWLAVLVSRVPAASLGVVLEADAAAGAFVPTAIVPDPRRDLTGLREIAEKALASGRPASRPEAETGLTRVAWPIRTGDDPAAAVLVLELRTLDDALIQQALREVHWASGWVQARAWEQRARDGFARLARSAVALDILGLTNEHRTPEAAAMAIVNEVQTVMACDQVSIGMIRGARTAPRIRLLALSYAAWFRKRSALVEGLETAMEESFDQGGAVSFPPIPALSRAISVAHGEHVRSSRTTHMLSVPLRDEAGPIGVITCERRGDRPFDAADLQMAESIAALIGPVLDLKRRNRRWLGGRLMDGTVHVLGVLLGPRRLSWKLLGVGLVALAVAAATVRGPFRVQADAVLRGAEQRAAVAPFAGYIAEARLRAGDVVTKGDILVRLDDADLRLEELRWRAEVDRLDAQARDALAKYDRPQVALLEAQRAQAEAQLSLAVAQRARTTILAPIDGVIVSGDLSQQLGAPVQPGDVLFEIAPLDRFRIEIHVDERDLRYVAQGQTGTLVLTSRPGSGVGFVTTRLTPVAEARADRNTFRVEAEPVADLTPAGGPDGLRPGMEGVAKIDAGEALLAWTWSRRMVDWLRSTLWTWQP